MTLLKDEMLYSNLSDEFIVRYVARIARILDREPLVKFSLSAMDQADRDLLFTVCYEGVVNFEDAPALNGAGQAYVPRPSFHTKSETDPDVVVGDTLLHHLIDDPLIERGIEYARRC